MPPAFTATRETCPLLMKLQGYSDYVKALGRSKIKAGLPTRHADPNQEVLLCIKGGVRKSSMLQ